jgi:hypothetical protein
MWTKWSGVSRATACHFAACVLLKQAAGYGCSAVTASAVIQ